MSELTGAEMVERAATICLEKAVAFSDDHEVAEKQHGLQREKDMLAIGADNPRRWTDASLIARVAWESGWDAAIIEVGKAEKQ